MEIKDAFLARSPHISPHESPKVSRANLFGKTKEPSATLTAVAELLASPSRVRRAVPLVPQKTIDEVPASPRLGMTRSTTLDAGTSAAAAARLRGHSAAPALNTKPQIIRGRRQPPRTSVEYRSEFGGANPFVNDLVGRKMTA